MIFIGVVLHIGLFIAILIAIGNWHDKKHAREVAALEARRAAQQQAKRSTKVRYSQPKPEKPEGVKVETPATSSDTVNKGFDSWLD